MMILLHAIVTFSYLLSLMKIQAHAVDRNIIKRDIATTSPPGVPSCVKAELDAFNDKTGKRYQLIAAGPTSPNGEIQTYQNSLIDELVTFRMAISAISPQGMTFTLINYKSGYKQAPLNSESQIARYRVNMFDKKALSHTTMLWLKGTEKCQYTMKNPPDIDDNYIINVVVMNSVPNS